MKRKKPEKENVSSTQIPLRIMVEELKKGKETPMEKDFFSYLNSLLEFYLKKTCDSYSKKDNSWTSSTPTLYNKLIKSTIRSQHWEIIRVRLKFFPKDNNLCFI